MFALLIALCLSGMARADESHAMRISHHDLSAEIFDRLIRYYDDWWIGNPADKQRCVAMMRELTLGRSFAITSASGTEADSKLREAQCLDGYSNLFGHHPNGASGNGPGATVMSAEPSIDVIGEYIFIHIMTFADTTENVVARVKELDEEKRSKIKIAVVDIRGNRGGDVEQLHRVLNGLFSPAKGIPYLRPKGKMTFAEPFTTDRRGILSGVQIRILTDEDTASSSEWMIETLCYEWYPDGTCLMLGTKTYGKAVLQCSRKFEYPDQHFWVKLTCAEWFMVNRRKQQDRIIPEKVQEVGIEPDKPMTFTGCERFAYACIARELAEAGL